ncbi:GON-4-like protein isoform X3 [Mesocricetus auratus]|uniref:GON-4-like protein isoform X3 n=1 Tax=Mesocricetus auratus TaxID=10036 RepID=A0ABM2Y4L3_MESAU|nr:GON-4-like protein isoform X3 [Mesocricetus auratus]
MLSCKKRRATVTESVHQQDDQEGDELDLESAVKPESVQLKDFGPESLSWGQHHESAVCPEVDSTRDIENQLSVEDPSLHPKMLTQHGNLPVLQAVDVAISQEITLPSLESSHSLTIHIDKERLEATASRKGKKIVFPPGLVTRKDQGHHAVIVEAPSGEPDGEVRAEGGTKRKRDGKGQERGTMADDLKLDDVLDRTLEAGAKQHNLTTVNQPPQFVDIHLEEDDSSDEEYQPDEEEEDETAEESLLESDVESTASSPRGGKRSRLRASSEVAETDEEMGVLSEAEKVTTPAVRHISAEVVPMGPPPPPKPKQTRDSAFMEKLNAVDEELASSPVCMDSFQPMEDSLIAFRTRSKMPLKDVPLGQLEAELQAPDITPDMYDPNTADDEDWKVWLGGLLNDDVENEDEADDDDDPECNFLEDLNEPDTEDFRTDRPVRITKKEVNGLMEELFETFQDEMEFSNMEEDGPDISESRRNFNTPQTLRFEEPLANLLNEGHRTVKEQLEQLKMKKSACKPQPEEERLKSQKETVHQTLILDPAQRSRLQQQMQQHVQLLTQIYLLTTSNPNLSSEASTTRVFLKELGTFAENSIALHQQFNPKFQTLFQPCNWMGAMQLMEDFTHVSVDCSPQKTAKKTASEFPCLPKQVAWILATNKVFMYPELLPICSLKANNPRDKVVFTKAEDNLLALGLKHFEGTEFPKPLISKYLVTCKTAHQLTVRIKNLNQNRAPNNVIKFYKKTKQLPVLVRCCEEIQPHQWKPPIEKEEHRLPFWLKASLQSIRDELRNIAEGAAEGGNVTPATETSTEQHLEKASSELGSETQYPLLIPKGVILKLKPGPKPLPKRVWQHKRPLVQKPLLIQPSPCVQPAFNLGKIATWPTQSDVPQGHIVVQIPHLIQPTTVLQTLPGFPPMGVSREDCIESPAALPAMPSGPEARTSLPLSESQPLLPSSSAPKIMLPSLAPSKFRKPFSRRKPTRRKGAKVSPCVKPAPIIHPTPVIFTVPATTVKVVSLASGCNVIQPVNAAVAPNPQTIPITTLLVNPTPFPCQLNQPLVASSIPPLIVSGNPLTLPVPSIPEDNALVNLDVTEGKDGLENPDSTLKPQGLTPLCATAFSKEEPMPWNSLSGMESQEASSESSACGCTVVKTETQEASSESSAFKWTVVKTESPETSSESRACNWTVVKTESLETSSEPRACNWTVVKIESQETSSQSSACDWTVVKTESLEGFSESRACGCTVVKTETQETSSESSTCAWTVVKTEQDGLALGAFPQRLQESLNSTSKDLEEMVKMEAEDCVGEIRSRFPEQGFGEKVKEEYSMELHSGSHQGKLSCSREMGKAAVVQREEAQAAASLSVSQASAEEGGTRGGARKGLSERTAPCMEQEPLLSSPPGKCVGTPAGPDPGGERDGPEDEEEEEFDDLTQDEEDELSSASEESVLSVPELQETMEKLTWLASERSMSQEGESEEENSQEENSEPEEEEEEAAEGMEALRKEEEVTGDAVGDAAEKPPSALASPKTAPEVETSITPPENHPMTMDVAEKNGKKRRYCEDFLQYAFASNNYSRN